MPSGASPSGPEYVLNTFMKKQPKPMPTILHEDMVTGVELCGLRVNLSAIARHTGLSQPHVSRLCNGVYDGMISGYIKIAGCIGVTIDELLEGIEERKRLRQEAADNALQAYKERIAREDAEAREAAAAGLPIVPRMSALRLPQDQPRVIRSQKVRTRG